MVTLPADTPFTSPVDGFTVAIPAVPELQMPHPERSDKVMLVSVLTDDGPVIGVIIL